MIYRGTEGTEKRKKAFHHEDTKDTKVTFLGASRQQPFFVLFVSSWFKRSSFFLPPR